MMCLMSQSFKKVHHLNCQSNFVPLKFALKIQDRLGKTVVLGLMINVIWVSVRLHDVFFGLEVTLCIFNKAGKDLAELLLALPCRSWPGVIR